MLKKYLSLYIIMVFSVSAFASIKQKITQTEVINFKSTQPTLSATKTKQGGCCWTNSIATTRPDAWRCSVKNVIYDPCFTTKTPNILVCNVNPSKKDEAFLIEIKKPLPKTIKTSAKMDRAWMIELADGTTCSPYTGTMPIIKDGNRSFGMEYGCISTDNNKHIGLLDGSIKPDKIWRTKKVVYTIQNHKAKTLNIQDVEIKKIWR
jgi:hypothetical protein